jgi:paraquat-inducible protein B
MSEYDDLPERRKPAHAEAAVHTSKWGPWVWVLPVLAIFFVGYLIVRYGFFGGGDITVKFAEARGLDRYSPVRYRGAKVGTVQKITVAEDLKGVVVRISMDASMNHALRKGTKFWIVEPGLEGGGIGSILSGTYVGIEPGHIDGEAEETREFDGMEVAPVLSPPEAGKTFILEGRGASSVSAGAPIIFNGIRVGRILGAEYDPARAVTSVHAFVQQRYAHHVKQTTRWWKGGGLNFSLSGGGVSMGGGGGIASLLSAPVAFYTPEVLAGNPVTERTRFVLHDSEGAAVASSDGPHLTYLTYFPGSIAGLRPGTPVTMKGVQVGRVREVRLRYLPDERALQTPVMIEIDPRQMEIPVTNAISRDVLRADINDVLDGLIQKGMRATLATSLVLPGASAVALETVGRPGTGRLNMTSEPPIIPVSQDANGLAGAMAAITDVANTVRGLPLREIAADIRGAAQRMNALVNDPALERSLQRLDRSMAEVERIAGVAGQNAGPIVSNLRSASESANRTATSVEATATKVGQSIDPIVESLRNAADSAETAAKRAEQLLGTSQKQNYDVAELIRELTRAAEAVRALATYLTENPDAVIKGRRQ